MDNGESSYRRFLEGDESAFDEIVDSLFYSLIYFVNGYLHDYQTAEDVAIDVFSDIYANKKRYNFSVSLKTYVFMIGKSKALNHLKRRKLISTVDFSEARDLSDDGLRLEEIVLDDERRRIVRSALERLPGDWQTAVHLIFFENMSCEEAARVMNKSKKQVYNMTARAKVRLREILGEEGKYLL